MRLLVALLAVALIQPVHAVADEIVVSAAASLTDALREIAPAWERAGGTRVVCNLGASGTLAQQILAGAPADVFLSADAARMDQLQAAGLVRVGDRVDLLSNALVVVVPRGTGTAVARPGDLAALGRIALADPAAVPAGTYARRWLESRGIWSAVQAKVVPALDVRAALGAVAGGHVDAAIVYRTDAATARGVRIAFEVPRAETPGIVYAVAALAGAKPAARDFVAYLRSPAGRAVFARLGFVVLGDP